MNSATESYGTFLGVIGQFLLRIESQIVFLRRCLKTQGNAGKLCTASVCIIQVFASTDLFASDGVTLDRVYSIWQSQAMEIVNCRIDYLHVYQGGGRLKNLSKTEVEAIVRDAKFDKPYVGLSDVCLALMKTPVTVDENNLPLSRFFFEGGRARSEIGGIETSLICNEGYYTRHIRTKGTNIVTLGREPGTTLAYVPCVSDFRYIPEQPRKWTTGSMDGHNLRMIPIDGINDPKEAFESTDLIEELVVEPTSGDVFERSLRSRDGTWTRVAFQKDFRLCAFGGRFPFCTVKAVFENNLLNKIGIDIVTDLAINCELPAEVDDLREMRVAPGDIVADARGAETKFYKVKQEGYASDYIVKPIQANKRSSVLFIVNCVVCMVIAVIMIARRRAGKMTEKGK
jgi:hypothetical protein